MRPGQPPQGGYCLDRTRKGLAKLLWALLALFFGFAGGLVFYMQMGEDRSAWELSDWAYTVFSAALCLGRQAAAIWSSLGLRRVVVWSCRRSSTIHS